MTLDSDIDLFLVRAASSKPVDRQGDPDVWEQRVTGLARSVTTWPGNDGRIVEYTEDELRAASAAREPLLSDVATQGLPFAGTRSWLNKQLRPVGKAAAARKS